MKRVLSFLIAAIMLFFLSACEKEGSKDPGDPGSSDPVSGGPVLHRLKKVTVTAGGKNIECNITWEDNTCYFESYMNYYKDPIENYRGVFAPETRTFSIIWDREDGTTLEIPVFDYDDDQRIISVYNEDAPSEVWAVTYDENGVPSYGGRAPFEYDPATKQVKRLYSGSVTQDGVSKKNYDVATLEDHGGLVSVDRLTYTEDQAGNVQLTDTKKDFYKITYDENGDVIRYEEPYYEGGFVIEYEYYDEPIHHLWEVTIPIHYIDIFEIYVVPFLWYLK